MQNLPDNLPATEENNSSGSKIRRTITSIAGIITLTSKEWLFSLLNQPTDPPFKFEANFNNELGRVIRLIIAVLLISGVFVGGVDLFTGKVDITKTFNYAITILIIAIFIALIYTPIFYICGVRICPKNKAKGESKPLNKEHVFYSVIYTFVPWVPILVFIKASITATNKPLLLDFLLIAPLICFAYMVVNLAKSIKLITNCSWIRIWLSVLIPPFLFLLYDAL